MTSPLRFTARGTRRGCQPSSSAKVCWSTSTAVPATHPGGLDSAEAPSVANARRRAGDAEPWQTILPVGEHLALVEQSGWTVTTTQWSPVSAAGVTHGRRSLLATAEPLLPE